MKRLAPFLGLWVLASGLWAQTTRVPPVRTIATLGACDTFKLVGVTDGASGATCSSGGGTTDVLCLCADGSWTPIPTSSSSGTVSSLAIAVPSEWSVSGSPVTTSGTITISEATQTANTVYAGPTTGSAATPGFRSLVSADIPNNAANTSGLAGTASALAVNPTGCDVGEFVTDIAANGALSCDTPAGGLGGSTGATDRTVIVSSGTGGATVQPATGFSLSADFARLTIPPASGGAGNISIRNNGANYVIVTVVFDRLAIDGNNGGALAASGGSFGWSENPFDPTDTISTYLRRYATGIVGVNYALRLTPSDTTPTCDAKGIQWERSSVDALCRCNGSTWDKLAGAGSCP